MKLTFLPRACFGMISCTEEVSDKVPHNTLIALLHRHFLNDWGDLDTEDKQMNARAVDECNGSRVHSVYQLPETGEDVWIISYLHKDSKLQKDPDCCNTVVLLPSEY